MIQKSTLFEFKDYAVEPSGILSFNYACHMESGEVLEFTEKLVLPEPLSHEKATRPDIVSVLQTIHLLLGTSYFKMFVQPEMKHPYALTAAQAAFWEKMYTQGMGEFYYINSIDFRNRVHFKVTSDASPELSTYFSSDKALIQHGGGKDSLTSVEIIKKAGTEFDLFTMNTSAIQELAAQAVGKPLKIIKRIVDPKMVELSKSGNVYNGHVPISVIYAFVSILYALIYDYSYVIASNEASANYGSVEYLGMQVNHQWAKSLEAEELIRDYTRNFITHDVEYFSLLRPLHEIKIVEIFSQFEKYFTSFSSSNHNFTIVEGKQSRWDITYSKGKVEFVFALFTAFLPKEKIMTIFEDDFYTHEGVLSRFQELLGKKDIKPLDCVGTPEEVSLAMYLAHTRGEYAGEPVMDYFEKEVLPEIQPKIEDMKKEVMGYGDDSHIPEKFRKVLKEMYSSNFEVQ